MGIRGQNVKKFWGFCRNEHYSVGCSGGTVYVYGSKGEEVAKFRHFPYAYTAIFKPNSNIIAVKSTEGFLGFYDLDSLSLIKKITVTRLGAQDEGFAFTPDGRYFCNIEKPVNSCQTQLGIYDGASFEKTNTLFADEQKTVLEELEFYGCETHVAYVLGFMRGGGGAFGYGFVGKLDIESGALTDIRAIGEERYNYLRWYKSWGRSGFTEKSLEWNPLNKLNNIGKTSIKAVFCAT